MCEAFLSHTDGALWCTDCLVVCNWPFLQQCSTVLSSTWVHVPVSWLCAMGTNVGTHVHVFAFTCVWCVCSHGITVGGDDSCINGHTRTHIKGPIYYTHTHTHTHTCTYTYARTHAHTPTWKFKGLAGLAVRSHFLLFTLWSHCYQNLLS